MSKSEERNRALEPTEEELDALQAALAPAASYSVWVMNKRCDKRVGRYPDAVTAITHGKESILPDHYVRVERWTDTGRTVVWDSMDGDSAEPGRKQQLRDFIRPKRASPAGGLRT